MAETKKLMTATAERCHDPYLRCALYGAAQAALGVTGCCVLAHSPQGCYLMLSGYPVVDGAFRWQDADYTETFILSTKLCEDEIVHGGEELLARTILEARELKVPILFVLSSCGPEIVGDDIVAVCEGMQPQVDFKIVPVKCAGFRGDQNYGTDLALDAILKRLVVRKSEKIPGSVCLIAPHANSNPTWMGDLAWVKGVLSSIGVKVLATLTHDTALSEFQDLASAEACIVLSHDAGQKAADYLAQEFGMEQLCKDMPLPVGFTNTRRWLTELGKKFNAQDAAEKLIVEGEKMVVEQCRRKGLEQFFMHRASAAIVADATVGIPLLHFIIEDLEMVPRLLCLRSCLPAMKQVLERELEELSISPRVVYDADVYQARLALGEVKPEVVFGSNIERHAVEEFDIPFIFRLVNPISRFRSINREYFGYVGMLNIIECIHNEWLDRYRSKEKSYKARW